MWWCGRGAPRANKEKAIRSTPSCERYASERTEKAGRSHVNSTLPNRPKGGAERAAFNEMLKWFKANAKRERITAILSHKLDRVCRNMRDAVRLQELDDTCGVQLAFVENEFGPGPVGALSFNVMAAVAQYYSDNVRTEALKGMDERVRQGWPTNLSVKGTSIVRASRGSIARRYPTSSTTASISASSNDVVKPIPANIDRTSIARPSKPASDSRRKESTPRKSGAPLGWRPASL